MGISIRQAWSEVKEGGVSLGRIIDPPVPSVNTELSIARNLQRVSYGASRGVCATSVVVGSVVGLISLLALSSSVSTGAIEELYLGVLSGAVSFAMIWGGIKLSKYLQAKIEALDSLQNN